MISEEEKLYRQKFAEVTTKIKARKKVISKYRKEDLVRMAQSHYNVSGINSKTPKFELLQIILDNELPYPREKRGSNFYENLPKYLTG
jgi:hypothetical protein